jgi:hypothetical protein
MFAKIKYVVITELTIATLFARVFVMRHQMLSVSLLFQQAHSWPLEKP